MYEVDERDAVSPLQDVPAPDIGAPLPRILADEGAVVLAYHAHRPPTKGWDGTSIRVVDPASEGLIALVRFKGAYAHYLGAPNDEAFRGHPLESRGLRPHAVFTVENSSWIRRLERMNRVHEYHKPQQFQALTHYIFAFHDSTFECAALAIEVTSRTSSLVTALPAMARLLRLRQFSDDEIAAAWRGE